VYPAVLLMYFISAAVILQASLAVMVQDSLPYSKTGSKGGRCIWLTTFHPCSAETSRKSRALIYPELLGPLRSVAGDLYLLYKMYRKLGGLQGPSGRVRKISHPTGFGMK